jgi:hypothetical protein
MPHAITKLTKAATGQVTLRTSVPKELAERLGMSEEDSLVWEWNAVADEARVRKA